MRGSAQRSLAIQSCPSGLLGQRSYRVIPMTRRERSRKRVELPLGNLDDLSNASEEIQHVRPIAFPHTAVKAQRS
jgi:hypothetical protein